jgi:hypothetical protein
MLSRCAICAATIVLAAFPVLADQIHHQINSSSGQLGSFVGTFTTDLNILSAGAFFDGSNFILESDQSGAIGTNPGAFYVWGINRGENLTPFAPFNIGENNVMFDAVVVLSDPMGAGSGFVFDIINNTTTPLPAGDVKFNGDTIAATVPGALLPTLGLLRQDQYQVNLWTRVGLNSADPTQLAEFAPNNSDVPVLAPEPASMGLFGLGLAGFAVLARRRRA